MKYKEILIASIVIALALGFIAYLQFFQKDDVVFGEIVHSIEEILIEDTENDSASLP
jgi:hypothetical protein